MHTYYIYRGGLWDCGLSPIEPVFKTNIFKIIIFKKAIAFKNIYSEINKSLALSETMAKQFK